MTDALATMLSPAIFFAFLPPLLAFATRQPSIGHLWGAYTPCFSLDTYESPPQGCRIDQVNLLQRHGARYPTSGASQGILSAINKLQSAPTYADSRLDFLKNFTYTLGEADLVPFGAHQSFEAGMLAFTRYRSLIHTMSLPFVRASSSERVVDSANNWTAGFAMASNGTSVPGLSVVLSESGNDTLDDSQCPNAGSSDSETSAWLEVFAPRITARLNRWAPGANLTNAETYSLMTMCPFHTVASFVGTEPLAPSPFCGIFSLEEFADFEYYSDLDKYYGTGYGGHLGRVQGVGYINELIARLTSTSVRDSTQTNLTLDADPTTFHLNRTFYADFSHDDEMIAIYAAMGLFRQFTALDPLRRESRTWVTSHLVPFSAQMVVERMFCETPSRDEEPRQLVRIWVNDALQPLEFCADDEARSDGGEAMARGLCSLSAFVESQSYATSGGEGDWEDCFV